MRAPVTALRAPAFGWLLLGAAAVTWAQGTLDLRVPPQDRGAGCRMCGEVRSIREVHTASTVPVPPQNPARATGTPASDWALVGAAVYTPIGRGTETDWQIGAVGTPEMTQRFGANTYDITVQMDGGEKKVVQRRDGPRFHVGQRVTLTDTLMEPL